MASRAVHIEVADSLDSDSFLNSLRRFIARRGPVKSIFCDNGMNLVGAQRDLHKAAHENTEKISDHLMKQDIEWHFNPPTASHFGGTWERQIRTIRKVLCNLLHEHGSRLNDECLSALLCEVESIVNSRPLTTTTDNADDLVPISPGMLLTLKQGGGAPPPGSFCNTAIYARRRWKRVQYLAELFWTRWKKEFIQSLQVRQKWNKDQEECSGWRHHPFNGT